MPGRISWEAHETAGNVVGAREAQRWIRELVGTVELAETVAAEQLRRRLSRCVFLAVVGTSRLPITSLESPLPGFSLGQLGYLPSRVAPGDRPLSSSGELIDQGLTTGLALVESAKLFESVLRASFANNWEVEQAYVYILTHPDQASSREIRCFD